MATRMHTIMLTKHRFSDIVMGLAVVEGGKLWLSNKGSLIKVGLHDFLWCIKQADWEGHAVVVEKGAALLSLQRETPRDWFTLRIHPYEVIGEIWGMFDVKEVLTAIKTEVAVCEAESLGSGS